MKNPDTTAWGSLLHPQTGLEVIEDHRRGDRLEIVVPVLNEAGRLGAFLAYYKAADVVLLDGGSTDGTLDIARSHGASVLRRVGPMVGENHFVLYANQYTKSGFSFYLLADEFVEAAELFTACAGAATADKVVAIRKNEWIYGQKSRMDHHPRGMPRGFPVGIAQYDALNLHDSLSCSAAHPRIVIDLHHLQVRSARREYGKFGHYVSIEVEQHRARSASWVRYTRSFVVPIITTFWRVWFERTTFSRKLVRLVDISARAHLALLCWLEQTRLPSEQEQKAIYENMYHRNEGE